MAVSEQDEMMELLATNLYDVICETLRKSDTNFDPSEEKMW